MIESLFGPFKTYIFDLDGVLFDNTARLAIMREGHDQPGWTPDWEQFALNWEMDTIYPQWVNLYQILDEDTPDSYMVLLSNRDETTRTNTETQLARAGICYDELILRPDRNTIPYESFKGMVLDEMLANGYDITLGFDDDPCHTDVYESRGIPFILVPSGYYDQVRIGESGVVNA